jgi:hypothetical protein
MPLHHHLLTDVVTMEEEEEKKEKTHYQIQRKAIKWSCYKP